MSSDALVEHIELSRAIHNACPSYPFIQYRLIASQTPDVRVHRWLNASVPLGTPNQQPGHQKQHTYLTPRIATRRISIRRVAIRTRADRIKEKEALRTCQELFTTPPVSPFLARTPQKATQEKSVDSQTQRNIPIPIRIILLKHIRHALQRNARLHEQVETQHPPSATIIRIKQQRDILLRQPIAERDQRVGELIVADGAGSVDVESVEELVPFG